MVNFEHILQPFSVFLSLTLSMYFFAGSTNDNADATVSIESQNVRGTTFCALAQWISKD